MKREATFCDRCGREIAPAAGERLAIKAHHDKLMDVCDECFAAFEAFMESVPKSRAPEIPKGYKRVARPCPHHVPCAEPWGCSGEEIVLESDPRENLADLYKRMRG